MKYQVTLNGKTYEVDVTECDAVITSITDAAPVAAAPAAPAAAPVAAPVAAAPAAAPAADGEKVVAPMPGNILAVNASVGQAVKAGDVLFILEAMKMENEIVAPSAGTVKQVLVSKGATVNTDDVLAVL
ncbi:MAG: biotin/lipoyl-binding protein [Clostridia bacterium]|nr:biotin/lipoyl-binding protein [Clostridia bacterium]